MKIRKLKNHKIIACCKFVAIAIISLLFALPASADWTLSATSGSVSMTDGSKTLYVAVLDSTARTLMLGYPNGNNNNRSTATGGINKGGSFDLTQRIVDKEGNEWTIVEVGPYAFYNNKGVTGTIDIPNVTNIAECAFGYATGITGFTLGKKLERIGTSAFNSTFGNLSFTPALPPSVKFIGAAAFAHHSKYDSGLPMKLQGTIELLGVETIEKSAFYSNVNVEKFVIGSKLTSFSETGVGVDSMEVTKGVFERCDKLHTIEWQCDAPSSFPKNAFWTSDVNACVTNYVYIDYLENWISCINKSGMIVGNLVSGNDPADIDPAAYDFTNPAVYEINPNDNSHKGKIYLSLLAGHPVAEGAPIFNSSPYVNKENGKFMFYANMDEGEDCDLFAVFTDLQGNTITNTLVTGVDGNADTFYSCEPTGLIENKVYSFGILGNKGSDYVLRNGSGTFFNGEISVSTTASISENGGSTVFTFSRGNAADTAQPDGELTILFTPSGSAVEFVNFKEVPRTVTIPAGVASAEVVVEAVIDIAVGDKSLSLIPDSNELYYVGSVGTTTIENWTPPVISDFEKEFEYQVTGYDAARGELENFPVLVRIPAGRVADNSQLAFFDENGTFLPYEIDTWNANGESLVWVLVPSFYQNVKITLASGNEGWTAPNLAHTLWRMAGYVAVLHLGEDGPEFAGSTVQNIDGLGQLANGTDAGVANKVAGAVGPARLISDTAGWDKARIKVDNFEGYLDNLANMTVSLWAKHSAEPQVGDSERIFGNRSNLEDQASGFNVSTYTGVTDTIPVLQARGNPTLNSSAGLDRFIVVKPSTGTNVSWSDTWTHLSFSFNYTPNPTIFHIGGERAAISPNGSGNAIQTTAFASILANDTPISFGNSYDEGQSGLGFKGAIDEIRIRNGSVSDDWSFAENATVADKLFMVSEATIAIAQTKDKYLSGFGDEVKISFDANLLGSKESLPAVVTIDWGDGTTDTVEQTLSNLVSEVFATHTYSESGEYIVTATASLSGSESSATATVQVIVIPTNLRVSQDDTFTRYALTYVSGYTGETELTDFPVLVRISEDSIDGFDYDECAEGGADISFSLADGTVLSHEIEQWNTEGESLVWVKLPTLDASTNFFYIRWNDETPPENDPSAVWSSYVAVLHGGNAITNAIEDGVEAIAGSGSVIALDDSGFIGGGIRKSVNKAIGINVVNPYSKLTSGKQFSVSAWFKRSGNGGNNKGTHILAANRPAWDSELGFLFLQEQGQYISVASKGAHNWSNGKYILIDQTWGHTGFTYDGEVGALTSYYNGIADMSKNNTPQLYNANVAYWTFGSYMNTASDDSYKGDIDEIRIYNGTASADWMKAEYDSMADDSFLLFGVALESTPVYGVMFIIY